MSTIDRPVTDTGAEPGAPGAAGPGAGLDLEGARTMPEFRASMATPAFTPAERELVVQQAAALIEGLYVHLAQKRSMYAIDPGQRLRLLRRRLAQVSDAEFHAQLSRILMELRDLHTVYVRPAPYRGRIAALGILVEHYVEGGESHFMVSKASPQLTGDTGLVAGAEVLHWNGSPMGLAVARNADREAGSNAAARFARGLESLAFRVLALSPPPDEDWVDLRYRAGGTIREARIPWRVFDGIAELRQASGGQFGIAGVPTPPHYLLGLDLRTDVVQDVKKVLFAPNVAAEQRRVEEAAGAAPEATPAQVASGEIPTSRPNELSARSVTTSHGTFGHLRIFTFHMQGPDAGQAIAAFQAEVARLLTLLPQEGLILDVRNNGGGYVYAGESLLQYFTPRPVQPEPTQFINTPLTAQLCRKVEFLEPWADSIEASIETGAQYSGGIPLYPAEAVNEIGQLYHGPVVLVTDAFCYSTTDFFAAGFQDHGIGKVLGVDDNTGAGGANVWGHADLVEDWPEGPFKAIPKGAMFQVALRRSLRVGQRWGGQPVEDLGVIPDVRHHITARDLTEANVDLMEAAGAVLAEGTPRRLDVEVLPPAGVPGAPEGITLGLTTAALTGVDAYVNGRPVATTPVTDGPNTLQVPVALAAGGSAIVRLEGFDGTDLVASRTLAITAG
jgi:C-terminal processing protease CtpA/Prc